MLPCLTVTFVSGDDFVRFEGFYLPGQGNCEWLRRICGQAVAICRNHSDPCKGSVYTLGQMGETGHEENFHTAHEYTKVAVWASSLWQADFPSC